MCYTNPWPSSPVPRHFVRTSLRRFSISCLGCCELVLQHRQIEFPILLPRVLKGWDSCLTRTFLLASEVLLQVKGQTLLTVCQGFRETACHSSVVEIKYHEQDNLYEKEFILTHGSGGIKCGGRQKANSVSLEQGTDRSSAESRERELEAEVDCIISSSSKTASPKPPRMALVTWGQVLKCSSLRSHFYSSHCRTQVERTLRKQGSSRFPPRGAAFSSAAFALFPP